MFATVVGVEMILERVEGGPRYVISDNFLIVEIPISYL